VGGRRSFSSGSGGASRERGRGSYAPWIHGGDHVYAHRSHWYREGRERLKKGRA